MCGAHQWLLQRRSLISSFQSSSQGWGMREVEVHVLCLCFFPMCLPCLFLKSLRKPKMSQCLCRPWLVTSRFFSAEGSALASCVLWLEMSLAICRGRSGLPAQSPKKVSKRAPGASAPEAQRVRKQSKIKFSSFFVRSLTPFSTLF